MSLQPVDSGSNRGERPDLSVISLSSSLRILLKKLSLVDVLISRKLAQAQVANVCLFVGNECLIMLIVVLSIIIS